MVAALRETVAGPGVQSQLRDYPHSYRNPESAARAMANALANVTARAARCEASGRALARDVATTLRAAATALAGGDAPRAAALLNATEARLRVVAEEGR